MAADVDWITEALSDAAMDAAWARAMDLIRADGEDPDELMQRAAANVTAWREFARANPDAHARMLDDALRAVAEDEV